MEKDQYKVIRVDGKETAHQGKPDIAEIMRLIGCSCLDTVSLTKTRTIVTMYVDDTGMIDGKPVNAKATALYRAVCKPGTLHSIHGDVVIVPAGGLA